MTCKKCNGPLSTQDRASYGEQCENCYCGLTPATTGGLPAAVRQGQQPDKSKHAKTCRNNKKTSGG